MPFDVSPDSDLVELRPDENVLGAPPDDFGLMVLAGLVGIARGATERDGVWTRGMEPPRGAEAIGLRGAFRGGALEKLRGTLRGACLGTYLGALRAAGLEITLGALRGAGLEIARGALRAAVFDILRGALRVADFEILRGAVRGGAFATLPGTLRVAVLGANRADGFEAWDRTWPFD